MQKKIRNFVIILSIISAGLLVFYWNKKQHSPGAVSVSDSRVATVKNNYKQLSLNYSKEAEVSAKRLLSLPLSSSSDDKSVSEYMNKLMKDPKIAVFFNYTLDFFKQKPEAFSAARFVAFTMPFDDGPDKFNLMTWTRKDLVKFSNDLMNDIEDSKDQVTVNPYFHNRILNLVHALDVPLERKLNFYANTIAQPIDVNAIGVLSDTSQVIEVALFLAKQSSNDPGKIAPSIARALALNQEPDQRMALQIRVLNYYPNLNYLFK